MTKYEWESELKKNIHRLPADEIARVMEYYDELFADKVEQGYRETEIIGQFGNPVDVADKILSEYDGDFADTPNVPPPSVGKSGVDGRTDASGAPSETREPSVASEPPTVAAASDTTAADAGKGAEQKTAGKRKVQGDRVALFLLLNILTGFAALIVAGSIWIVAGALCVSGFACAVGGAAATIVSAVTFVYGGIGATVAQIGVCLAVCGCGILLSVVLCKGVKYLAKATAYVFRGVGHWIRPVQKSEVQA